MALPRRVLKVAVDEAKDILRTQDRVVGYLTVEDAEQIRVGLLEKGVKTKVISEVGPMIALHSPWDAYVARSLELEPGTRYTRWGLKRVRGHKRQVSRGHVRTGK